MTINTTTDLGTSSSSLTDRSTSGLSASSAPGHPTNLVYHQEKLNSVKAQLSVLQQQHTNLFQMVKQMPQQHTLDKQELKRTIADNLNSLQSYVSTGLNQNAKQITANLQAQYTESIKNQLRL